MIKIIYSYLIALLFLSNTVHAQTYNIRDFGAKSEATAMNTKAIQEAIDACSKTGGTVLVPEGIFIAGTLYLKNNVNLSISKGGVLKGSASFADYPDNKVSYANAFTHDQNGKSMANKAFIFAEGLNNISLSGEGTIDGSGDSPTFQLGNDDTPASRLRPCMLLIIDSKHITVSNLTLRNSAYWMQNYLGCEYLKLTGLTVFAQSNYNQDGMDIDAKHVLVENCTVDVDDDGICFKSHDKNRPVEDIIVRNCKISTNCNAIKFGTMSIAGLKDVTISNISIKKASSDHIRQWQKNLKFIGLPTTVLAGIALESVDGAKIENIKITNIVMEDVQTPIFIVLGNRGRTQGASKGFYETQQTASPFRSVGGQIRNIQIENIVATSHSKMASSITAFPGQYIENVKLTNIVLHNMGKGTIEEGKLKIAENPSAYPENRMYGLVLPASGLFVRHVKGLKLDNVVTDVRYPDFRPSIYVEDVIGLTIRSLRAPAKTAAVPVVKLINSKQVVFEDKP